MNRGGEGKSTRMAEQVTIHLKYEGPDVENGTMALQDVIPVLQGFSGAYATLAAIEDPDSEYRIHISGVRRGSADILLEAWKWVDENADSIEAATAIATVGGSIVLYIVKTILDVAKLKVHVGDGTSKENISLENGVVVQNSDGGQIIVNVKTFNNYKDGILDRDLERLTRPLEEGRIDSAEFKVRSGNEEVISHRITAEDRPHFEMEDLAVTSTRETQLVAKLNSLTKSTNSGYLYLQNGKRVFYRYLGEDYLNLHAIFGNYDGAVKIRCEARMDDQLEVVSLDIFQIERMQNDLFDTSSSPANTNLN